MSLSPRITIVIPTYNERGSLRELVERIAGLRLPDYQLLVVDDNSPDGTGALAEEFAGAHPITVLHRARKEGLGRAYAHVFSELLRLPPEAQPEYVIQMDADLSHDPRDIPRLLRAVRNCDVALGSRYVRGGKIENWGIVRRLVSAGGNRYAAFVLGLPYKDLTGGYKCFRFSALQSIGTRSTSSVGYNFQIEMTYLAHKNGLRISEIPITFTERKTGISKFNLRIILESFIRVLFIRFRQ